MRVKPFIIDCARKVVFPKSDGYCLWCGVKLRAKSEFKDKRLYSQYFCNSVCRTDYMKKYYFEFSWNGIRERVIQRDEYTCFSCAKVFPPELLEVDHIIAITNGGKYLEMSNLQTLCKSCHQKKTYVDIFQSNNPRQQILDSFW